MSPLGGGESWSVCLVSQTKLGPLCLQARGPEAGARLRLEPWTHAQKLWDLHCLKNSPWHTIDAWSAASLAGVAARAEARTEVCILSGGLCDSGLVPHLSRSLRAAGRMKAGSKCKDGA